MGKTKLVRIGVKEADYLKELKNRNKLNSSGSALQKMVNFFEIQEKKKRIKEKIIREIEF